LCVLIYTCGILYIIFILQEVKVAPLITEADKNGHNSEGIENPGFVVERGVVDKGTSAITIKRNETTTTEVVKVGFLREFFDPTLALSLIDVVFKKREGNLRKLLFLVLICNIVFLASLGENDLTYFYTRLKINWSGVEFALHITYGTAIALAGTLLMVGVFSKFLGISDPMIGIISTLFTLISKPVYVSKLRNCKGL
jgi:hypothetical protein